MPTTTGATTTSGATTTTLRTARRRPCPMPSRPRPPSPPSTRCPCSTATPTAIPDHPTSLEGVFWDFKVPDELASRLAADGFALSGTWSSDVLHAVYSYAARYADGPVYVTTDAGYHEWHLVFSKALRDAEEQALLPLLEDLVGGLVQAARGQEAGMPPAPPWPRPPAT